MKRKEAEIEERKKASHDMVAESIRRELLESTYTFYPYQNSLNCTAPDQLMLAVMFRLLGAVAERLYN